ncbi:MAG: valine--pyruvate transaminase, partial [Planctomycetaceae bacterium]|nr:valine--pyruvate transaminase [Planctomycetaceae bacterium]
MTQSHPEFSVFGQKLTGDIGIYGLMEDLGRAMTTHPDMLMLGGGNPAAVPAMQQIFRERMEELLADGSAFDRMLGNYDPPQGNPRFQQSMADMLSRTY